ncbi:hypothetical protein PINS_up014639 [Pythium insidiosum]|nr:hypothetical protein PINS_up014639 [Pythium insidiosum]
MASMSAALPPTALHARVQKLLGSRAEIEATKALLHTLVSSDTASASSASASPTAPSSTVVTLDATSSASLADLRKTLRTSLEEKQLALAESALGSLAQTLQRVTALQQNVHQLDAKCQSIQSFLEATKRGTQQVQQEAAALTAKQTRVQSELEGVQQFLARYQLTEDEIQCLYAKTLTDEDMTTFFAVMERVQQIKGDCRTLVAEGDVNCALELLETVGKYQEVGFERLYQWTSRKCADVEGEPSAQLHRAIALLQDRSEFYNYCKESLTSSRRSLIVKRFIMALTRGGPNGIPRPIEMYAHDPVRYCGDMLAWVHQAIATEEEFFRVLFNGDLSYDPSPLLSSTTNTGVEESQGERETMMTTQEGDAARTNTAPAATSLIGRAFEGVARPLQVRIEQTLAAPHGIVVTYKLVHLLAFYRLKFCALIEHSGVAQALTTCHATSLQVFQQQYDVLVQGVAASAQDYSTNLGATQAVMEISHRLVTLLEVAQTSLLPDEEREADLQSIFERVLAAVKQMCERTVESLDPLDALVFQINNLSCIRVPLTRFREARRWFDALGDDIEQLLNAMSALQAQRLLDRYNVTAIVQEMERAKLHGDCKLDGETVSSVMEDFSAALLALILPQFDTLTQPTLRERGRLLTASRLAATYTSIYDFVHDPRHGLRTSHSTTAALGGSHAILLHTPQEIRTALEID